MSGGIGGVGPCSLAVERGTPRVGEPAVLTAGSPRYPSTPTQGAGETEPLPALVTVVAQHPPHSLVLTPRGTLVWTHTSCLRCVV